MTKRKHTYGRLTKENVDDYISDLMSQNNGNYIVQSVAFNKSDDKQMSLLRTALLQSRSFGAYVRELLADVERGSITTQPPSKSAAQTQPNNITPNNINGARIANGQKSKFYT